MIRSAVILFLFLFVETCAPAQVESVTKQRSKALFEALNYHRDHSNFDSAIYYNDLLISMYAAESKKAAIITKKFQKINTLILFNRHSEGYELALDTYDEYCGENKPESNCKGCRHIYEKLSEFMVMMQDYRQAIRCLDLICDKENHGLYYHDKATLYSLLYLPDSALAVAQTYIGITEKEGKPRQRIAAYNNHGLIAKRVGRLHEGIAAFSNALQLVDSLAMIPSMICTQKRGLRRTKVIFG